MKFIRHAPFVALAAVFLFSAALYGTSEAAEPRHREFSKKEKKEMTEKHAIIETKFGNIELRFFPDVAPNHVDNFITLAEKGFYDGTTFHRIVPGFVIQGGDPAGNGTGGPGYTVKAEFNEKKHTRGRLSMARSSHPDSAGSQFFIVVEDKPFLDGKYTVFGEVVNGMDVVDKIVSQPRTPGDKPKEPIEMKVRIVEQEEDKN